MRAAKKIPVLMLPLLLGTMPLFAQQQSQSQEQSSPPPSSQTSSSQSDQTAPAKEPANNAPQAKKPTTAEENPFPEDISRKAAEGDDGSSSAGKSPATPGKTSSVPPRNDDSSSRSNFQGLGDVTGTGNRISNGAGGYIVSPKLATEDVKVGGFYLDRHDYKGAYSRYKEATLVDPANADAVFGLAAAARGLNHKDEAMQNFQVYLDAFPDGKKAKEARKALAEMGTSPVAKK